MLQKKDRLKILKERHFDKGIEIDGLEKQREHDRTENSHVKLKNLKKEKLVLKDEIEQAEKAILTEQRNLA